MAVSRALTDFPEATSLSGTDLTFVYQSGVAKYATVNTFLAGVDTLTLSTLTVTGTATINNLVLTTALPVTYGGTGATTAADARSNLGLGTMATQAASSVAITGGTVTGITDLAVADGGTGSSTAADARTALGLAIGTDVQAYDAGLTDIAGLAVTDGNIIVGDGANWVAESGATARASLGLTIGTDVQAYDAGLANIAGLAVTDGNIIVGDGANWVAESGATARTSLGFTDPVLDKDAPGTIGATTPSSGKFTTLESTDAIHTPGGEKGNAIGSTGGGTQDIDLDNGRVQSLTVDTSANTFTFSNPAAYDWFTLIITNGGSQTVNWPLSINWAGGSAPSLTAAGVDIITFVTNDTGTTWYGFAAGLDMQ
jgi:hypothetical protein